MLRSRGEEAGGRREPSRPHARKSDLSRLLPLPAIISPIAVHHESPAPVPTGRRVRGSASPKGSGMQDTAS